MREDIRQSFLRDINKQKEFTERYNKLSDEEKEHLKEEQKREAEILNDILCQVTGSSPSWF